MKLDRTAPIEEVKEAFEEDLIEYLSLLRVHQEMSPEDKAGPRGKEVRIKKTFLSGSLHDTVMLLELRDEESPGAWRDCLEKWTRGLTE